MNKTANIKYIPVDAFYDFKNDKLHYIVKKINNKKNKKITNIKKSPSIKIRTAPFTKKFIYFLDTKFTSEIEIKYKDYMYLKKAIKCVYEKKPIKYRKRGVLAKYHDLVSLKKEIYNDFKVETQFLQNENFEYPDNYIDYINIGIWDIEVEHDDSEFPESSEAKYPINAIALYHRNTNSIYFYVLLRKDYHSDDVSVYTNKINKILSDNFDNVDNINIFTFYDEKELLKSYLAFISVNIDVLVGWNSIDFDTVYVYNRCKKLNIEKYFKLSFGDIFKILNVVDGKQGMKSNTFYTTNILSIDYIHLLKFFDRKQRPSYKLNNVSKKILKDSKNKLTTKLDIGNINDSYQNNFIEFCLYNVNDVMLIDAIDSKIQYINLLFNMKKMAGGFSASYLSINNILDSYISLKSKEYNIACISSIKSETFYSNKIWNIYRKVNVLTSHRLKLINEIREKHKGFSLLLNDEDLAKLSEKSILDEDIEFDDNNETRLTKTQISFLFKKNKYPGAYVMKPKPDVYLNVVDLDAQSLYPSIIYCLNCSHETWIYLIPENIALKYIYEKKELFNFLENNNIKIPIYDVRNDIIKVVPSNDFINILKTMQQKELIITETGAIFIPSHIQEGILRKLIAEPIEERISTKNKMNEIKSELGLRDDSPEIISLNTIQLVLKILANSVYGFQGYSRSRLFNLILAATITLFGQFMIRYVGMQADKIITDINKKR